MLNEEQLDSVIRREKGKNAVVECTKATMVSETYLLSDNTRMIVSRNTGNGRIEDRHGKVIRRFKGEPPAPKDIIPVR